MMPQGIEMLSPYPVQIPGIKEQPTGHANQWAKREPKPDPQVQWPNTKPVL